MSRQQCNSVHHMEQPFQSKNDCSSSASRLNHYALSIMMDQQRARKVSRLAHDPGSRVSLRRLAQCWIFVRSGLHRYRDVLDKTHAARAASA